MQGGVLRAGRYELRRATMLDLIKTAYGVDADTVFGGPSWLEWDRFDVIAKAAPATSAATLKLMLQALLADRFKLAVHKDTRPMPGFALTAGKGKLKMKEADGSGDSGCQAQPRPPSPNAVPPRLVSCRNMTMDAFAPALRGLDEGSLTGPVVDQTGLKGAWDFDLMWDDKRGLLALPAGDERTTIFEAVDKQLGLKLEPQKVPMPVLVIDRVNEQPTANLPEVTTSLPPPPPPEFEVASIRPSVPGAPPGRRLIQPGGRVEMRAIPLALLILQAWDLNIGPDEIQGAPKWLKPFEPAFDLVAKAPATTIIGAQISNDDFDPMLRALLADRFKLAAHYEDRPMDAYTLVAAKPKLKKADPSSRTACKAERSTAIIAACRNMTMAQFAGQLQTIAPNYVHYPALDATGLSGAWDFTFTFSPIPPNQLAAAGSQGGARAGPAAPSGDPVGGVSLFDALQKQLGLKLERHKRPEPVFVIDHIEEKPVDN